MAINKEKAVFKDFMKNISMEVNFDLRLPSMVFKNKVEKFWFFERPLMSCYELVEEILTLSGTDSYIKFSGLDPIMESFILINKNNVQYDIIKAHEISTNFGKGNLSYPLVLCDSYMRWIAVEDVTEDFGVLALKDNLLFDHGNNFLEENFISPSQMVGLSESGCHGSKAAKAFIDNYIINNLKD
ncbi:hypothetical protein JWH11_00800 [Xanthomonas melonis]|uniref:Uncharacterized protein n=1 Tax=Xanthomonas melonis TaxID=56456 RepID=A0ABS8NPL2_9XANT|nr:hypothetical protein [Xanthomonas melonis]MCD0244413.1 hypothetical protein [Xanthomonas melonis]MCD0256728.1 hypothetical protein [Xanthomonas melonis]MCD0265001.1 hypothetical protein [Xanthomonas melonis]